MIETIKQQLLRRSKIIRGQLEALVSSVENEDYCVDILTQSLAIQRGLRSLNKLIVENHIQTHISYDLLSNDVVRQQKAKKELLDIYELTNVRGK
jgi:DNA-binding FrmR family transcriptional regulator